MILILDNIRSAHNVGSIFRTADAVGVSKILLCGVTPDPVDRFGRDRSDISKVSLGAEKNISWGHVETTIEAIELVKKEGLFVVALEQDDRSAPYKEISKRYSFEDCVLVAGEETKGLQSEVLSLCDAVAEIPMKGQKESLNVAVATAVFLYSFD